MKPPFEQKSHVGMGHSLCPICCKEHDEVVLVDTRLRQTLTKDMITGWAMCPEHKRLKDEGYVALVEVSNTNAPTLENAVRTGNLAHVRAEAWPHLFNVPVPERGMCFVEPGAIQKLQKVTEDAE